MKSLSILTKIYILCTLLAGTILFSISVMRWNWQETWMQTIILSVLGALTLLFMVEGSTDRTHYDLTFLIYGCVLVLFGAPSAVIMILVAHILEWIRHRYVWYIQVFNISSYIVVAVATNMIYELANPSRNLSTWQGAISMLAAMAFFTLFNHVMIGVIVWLARGENFVQSGIFRFFPLMLDWIMLCMGAGVAVVWSFNPLAVILILLPLYLIYRTLRVPALERQIETDLKTGLFNLNYFKTVLEAEIHRAERFDRPLTVVMADMDLLRNINNTYGHLAGDEVLIGVAKILKEFRREYDIVARFGGEEFSIMMPETTPEEAYALVRAMRLAIETAQFAVPTSVTPIRVTMSFGIAGRMTNSNVDGLIHNADMALYHAKLKGRNRAVLYSDDGFLDVISDPVIITPVSPNVEKTPERQGNPAETKVDQPADQPTLERPVSRVEAENQPKGNQKKAKPWVDIYILDLALVAFGLFSLTILNFSTVDWPGILIFTILVAATEWASIDIYVRNTAVSTSVVPLAAGILLFGPVAAIFMSFTIAAVALIKHKSPFSRFIFNTSNQLLAAMACILLVQSTGSHFTDWPLLIQVIVSAAAGMLIFGVTSILTAVGVSISFREPIGRVWNQQFSWLAPYYFGAGIIAYALIFSYLYSGLLGTLVVLIPLALLRTSQKQFIDRTKSTVNELKVKNKVLEEKSNEIIRMNNGLLDTLAEVIDLRDPYIFGHSQQVTSYAVLIARQMGLTVAQIEAIRKASMMHDVGKLGIEASLLSKPSSLTDSEFEMMKQHVTLGAELLKKNQSLKPLIPIVLHHHEHFDGSGYPDHLQGVEIPLEARIVCLADAVEAMASDRPYRRALSFEAILKEISRCSGKNFDPEVVKAFEKIAENNGSSIIKNINSPVAEPASNPSIDIRVTHSGNPMDPLPSV